VVLLQNAFHWYKYMGVGIEFQLIWHDNDVLNLRVSAWNGDFGGVAEIYEGVGDLHVAASNLRGFPNNLRDRREIVFGNFDRKCAAGGVSMRISLCGRCRTRLC
jgi:hypothetical protein